MKTGIICYDVGSSTCLDFVSPTRVGRNNNGLCLTSTDQNAVYCMKGYCLDNLNNKQCQ